MIVTYNALYYILYIGVIIKRNRYATKMLLGNQERSY